MVKNPLVIILIVLSLCFVCPFMICHVRIISCLVDDPQTLQHPGIFHVVND